MSRALPVLLCTVLMAVLPAAAVSKGPPREPDHGPDPRGLTLSGTGIADVRVSGRPTQAAIERAVVAARPAALGRAVRRARARAASLATAARLTLGRAVVVTVRDQGLEQGFIGRERYCARSRRGARRRCSAPRMAAVTVTVTFATAQTSAAVATGRALVVPGIATVPVLPEDRRSSPSILRAQAAAQDAAAPAALAAAVRTARTTAAPAGMPAGTLIAIAEVRRPFEDFSAGSFGTGRFCDLVRRATGRRDPATGRRRTVRRRGCFFPRELSVGLRLTYAS